MGGKIILYTIPNSCARCDILRTKLTGTGVQFTEENDVDFLKGLGIMSAPVLSVNGNLLQYGEAIKFVNNYKGD